MNWHGMTADEVLRELDSSPVGLAGEEADRRLVRNGRNELTREDKASPLLLFLGQFKNLLIVILLVATLLSLLVGEYVDAVIIAVIVLFSALLGFTQEYKAEKALEALKKMLHATITVRRDGKEVEIDAAEVVPGDVMLLEAGDKIPADGRIIECASLQCDESSLTGESHPVPKECGFIGEKSTGLGDRRNMVYTGSVVTYGRAATVVTGTAMETEFGRIAREVAAVEDVKTPLEVRTKEIGRWLGIVSLSVCLLVVTISSLREHYNGTLSADSVLRMVMFGVALAVAAVPEALAAIVTGALAIGMREMAKRNALVRRMPAVETLGCTTVICTDKTGTLTKGEMTVRKIWNPSEGLLDVSGAGYSPEGEISGSRDAEALQALLTSAVLCNDSDLLRDPEGGWKIKGDPTEGALLVLAAKGGVDHRTLRENRRRVDEVPFSSERKMMSTVNEGAGGGRTVYSKGAPEVILERVSHVLEGGRLRPAEPEDLQRAREINEEMAASALRVLAVAYREAGSGRGEEYEKGLVFAGLVGMMDPPRPEAVEAVAVCRQVHMRTVMITGDHRLTAVAVAKEMGIYQEGDLVLTGSELEEMSQEELDGEVEKVTVYARVSPMDKLKIISAWKNRGEVVAMTGDGVNDAPALKHADIGIAMGVTGTEVAKEAADMVLSDDNFASIVAAIERGRWIYDNIKKYLTYLLRCNVTEVLVIGGVVLAMGPKYLPLLPAAILYVNLATDGLPALALGLSPPDPDLMSRPPRRPGESVFSWEVRTFVIMAVIIEIPLFLWVFFRSDPGSNIELARTRMFFMFIVLELAIALNFRSLRYGLIKAPPHKWLWLAIVWEVLLIAVLMAFPTVRESFGVAVPAWRDLVEIFGLALVVMGAMEAVKAVLRRTASHAEAQKAVSTEG